MTTTDTEHKCKTYRNPIPTVDLVIGYNGGIVIIERNEEPIGYALPGGHIGYGESAETAAIREAKEETGLEVKLSGLIGVFSDPERDKRGHRISIAYAGRGTGVLKAGSDAKTVSVIPFGEIPPLQFDHDKILEKFRENYFDLK
ncbi:NUDIX hydrolase [Candidatus Woesearchaeota archaeon]|nr:NUDIX hydrolase [Candidatus Woesearchaeota archaeon]